jgi:hypothetical protein
MQDQRLDRIEGFHLVTANLPRLTSKSSAAPPIQHQPPLPPMKWRCSAFPAAVRARLFAWANK